MNRFRGWAARRKPPSRSRERGLAVLITLLLVLGVGIGLVTSGVTRSVPLQVRAEHRIKIATAEAKQALIGRAVADADKPGSLPCPDAVTNVAGVNVPNDGIADDIVSADGHCPSYIGRLPWKTLGLPDLRDEHGHRLWYALSPKYKDHPAWPINSDTPSVVLPPPFDIHNDRVVHANSQAEILVAQAVAVIFSPGGPVGDQLRDGTAAPCAATGTVIPRNLCVSNYLEATGGVNNASATGPYIAAAKSADFNDRLAIVTAADLMPLVEMRVAAELRRVLVEYKVESKCKCYPYPADALGVSVAGWNRGRVPTVSALPEAWGSGRVPLLPPWFDANRWGDVIYYTVAQAHLDPKGPACSTCTSPTLILDTLGGYSSLFITPGPASGPGARAYWSGYIDDPVNSDGDDVYITPTSTALARDRFMLMPSASPLQCAANATMLFQNAPCQLRKETGPNKKLIKPECTYAAANLQVCTCSAEAQVLLTKPCSKKIKKSECKSAVTTLKVCNA